MKKWFGPWSAARSREDRLSAGALGFKESESRTIGVCATVYRAAHASRVDAQTSLSAVDWSPRATSRRVHWFSQRSGASWFDSENAVVSDESQVGERLCSSCYD